MQFPERRKYKRIKRPFTARIRTYQTNINTDASAKWDIVTIRNLSAVGVSFNHTQKLTLGTMLEFIIALPFSKEPIYCIGKVSRIDKSQIGDIRTPQIPVYGIAACFTEIDDIGKEAIIKYTKNYE